MQRQAEMSSASDADLAEDKHNSSQVRWTKKELQGQTCNKCQCHRKTCVEPSIDKDLWAKEQDKQVMELMAKYGSKRWSLIARHLHGRLGKQVRKRWTKHLNPLVKRSSWTAEEDLIIYKAHAILGNQWTEIARLVPGRSINAVRRHWNATLRHKAQQGFYKDQEDTVMLDIQRYTQEEGDFSCDMVLDAIPVSSEEETNGLKSYCVASSDWGRSSLSSSPSLYPSPLDPEDFTEATLRMISEDMLPMSVVEGSGFRAFVSALSPHQAKLSQHALGLHLYNVVERTIKPGLIRELRACHATGGAIHVTCDLWAGGSRGAWAELPALVVQLHFLSDSWQIRRPVVALRQLDRRNLGPAVNQELEEVLLGYGIFPHAVGHVLANPAKDALLANGLLCDLNAKTDSEDLSTFLSDPTHEAQAALGEVHLGTRMSCVAWSLQFVIQGALKSSRQVDNLLSQLQGVVTFFRSSSQWSQMLQMECGVTLPPSLGICWTSLLAVMRRLTQAAVWDRVTALLAQARMEASDDDAVPPLLIAKRQQAVDVLSLLEPFEEVMQELHLAGVTFSSVLPLLARLDRTLESRVTAYTHFSRALRAGLFAHCQCLMDNRDMVLATVLDPRIKLEPFTYVKQEGTTCFLTLPSKSEAHSIVNAAVEAATDSCMLQRTPQELDHHTMSQLSGCNGDTRNCCKSCAHHPADSQPSWEVNQYLSEPLLDSGSVQAYWASVECFPRLRGLAKKLLAVPATSGGFERLCPLATCIVRAKRNRLPPHTTERLLLYRDAIRTKTWKPDGHRAWRLKDAQTLETPQVSSHRRSRSEQIQTQTEPPGVKGDIGSGL